jgi:hypothetical protein
MNLVVAGKICVNKKDILAKSKLKKPGLFKTISIPNPASVSLNNIGWSFTPSISWIGTFAVYDTTTALPAAAALNVRTPGDAKLLVN